MENAVRHHAGRPDTAHPDRDTVAVVPRVRYADSNGLQIAYQVISEGSPNIVCVDGFVSHRDLEWDIPLFRAQLDRLMAMGRAVVFDKRGTGLSDRDLGYGTLEDRMDDIRAVMDATGIGRASLIGTSEGGPLSILFAATYPERVDRLVLYASFCCSRWWPDHPWGQTSEEHAEGVKLIESYWGSGSVMGYFAGLLDQPQLRDSLARYERSAASPSMARRIAEANWHIDTRPILTAIAVPTLVVHHVDDPLLPIEAARWMASRIPGAELVEVDGLGGVHLSDSPAVWDAVHEFVTGEQRHDDIDRVLSTVLFTDIVASTERAAELGDAAWRALLDRHDDITSRCVERHRGRIVKTTGDGVFAVFDGPARGIRCAHAIIEETANVGIAVRAGLHTGECEVRGDDYAGMTVHIGARVSALAGPGEVKVTSTVRDLVIGSDIDFVDCGTATLKGVPGEWSILAAS